MSCLCPHLPPYEKWPVFLEARRESYWLILALLPGWSRWKVAVILGFLNPPAPSHLPRCGCLGISLFRCSSNSKLTVEAGTQRISFCTFSLYLIQILATFVRKKKKAQPWVEAAQVAFSFLALLPGAPKRNAEAAPRTCSLALPPGRVASVNFSQCKTSDCS